MTNASRDDNGIDQGGALIAKFVLHEQVTMLRWVGIFLIAVGVSAVASGPELTRTHQREPEPELTALQEDR
jgi:drug/metabolite transporter (DMT)-like permease